MSNFLPLLTCKSAIARGLTKPTKLWGLSDNDNQFLALNYEKEIG